jgi:hypothetical protein
MTSPSDQIWAYLHDELSPEDRQQFEQAVDSDPALKVELEESRNTHDILKTLLPHGELNQEELTNQLLAQWETEHPEFAQEPEIRSKPKILRFAAPLAAAAAVIILLALPSGPIDWQRTLYGSAPQLRGEPATQPHYTRSDLKQAVRELQDAIEESFDGSGTPSLQISIQELADGALAVEIIGTSRHWNESFQSLETFRRNVPTFGKQIADDL